MRPGETRKRENARISEQAKCLRSLGRRALDVALTLAFLVAVVEARAQTTKASGPGISSGALPILQTRVAFPNLRFDRPVALAYPADGSKLLFVVEQHAAKIWSYPNDRSTSDKVEFLKLPDPINRGNEEGLLGWRSIPSTRKTSIFCLLFGGRQRQEAFRGLPVPGVERQPANSRPGQRRADLGLGRRPL